MKFYDGAFVNEYQSWIKQTAWYNHCDEANAKELSYLMHGLAGEAGETVDVVKKIVRTAGFDDKDEFDAALADGLSLEHVYELSDVLWYITQTCSFHGISLEELMLLNMVKLHKRLTTGAWKGKLDTDKERAKKTRKGGKVEWPRIRNLPYEEALKLTQHIESRITDRSVLTFTDTDTK